LSRSVKLWSDRVFRDLLSGQPSGPSTLLPVRVLSVSLRTSPPGPPFRTTRVLLFLSPDRRLGPAIGPRVLQRYLRVPPDLHQVTSPDITLVPDPQPRSRLSCFPTIRSDLQFPFSSSRITPSDPRRTRPPAQFIPTADSDLRPVGTRFYLVENPLSPSRRVLFVFRLPTTIFCSSVPPSTPCCRQSKWITTAAVHATVRMKPISVGSHCGPFLYGHCGTCSYSTIPSPVATGRFSLTLLPPVAL
jgi:hypothetical protein